MLKPDNFPFVQDSFVWNGARLRHFYDSRLGCWITHHAVGLLKAILKNFELQETSGVVLGLGYTKPYMHLLGMKEHICFYARPNWLGNQDLGYQDHRTVIFAQPNHVPIHGQSVHQTLLIHAAKSKSDLVEYFVEARRITVPGGLLIGLLPLWGNGWFLSRHIPFCNDVSVTTRYLHNTLNSAGWWVLGMQYGIHCWPIWGEDTVRALPIWEKFARLLLPITAGIVAFVAVNGMMRQKLVKITPRKLRLPNLSALPR